MAAVVESFRATNGKKASAKEDDASGDTPGLIRRMGKAVDYGLTAFFGTIGAFVARHPWVTIACSLLLTCICAVGIIRINVNTDSEDLYTPQGNKAFDDRDYVQAAYGYERRVTDVFVTARKGTEVNILTKEVLLEVYALYEGIRTFEAKNKTLTFTLESDFICYRPGGANTPCSSVSILDYWNYNTTFIQSDPDLFATVSNINAEDRLARSINPGEIMGGIQRDPSTNKITSVAAFKLVFENQNNQKGGKSSNVDKTMDAWEQAAKKYVTKTYKATAIDAWIRTDWDESDTSDKTITGDVSLLIIGYVLLVFYGLLVLAKRHAVYSSSWLALANVGSIAMAVVCSFGVCMAVGIDFSLVTQVLALLLLGLGTDDMLVTIAAHEETYDELGSAADVEQRIRETVSRARRSVVVASATNAVAFVVGTTSDIPALRDFMIYASVGVVFVLIFQSTFFVACLTLDVRRQQANKFDLLCCVTSSATPTQGCFGSYDDTSPKISQRLIGMWLPKLILNPYGKIVVLLITAALLAVGIAGALKVKENFDDESFIPNGSYLKDVYRVRDQYFAGNILPFSVYTKKVGDYFNHQDELQAIYTSFSSVDSQRYITPLIPVKSWYTSYIEWLQEGGAGALIPLNADSRPQSSADFYKGLALFLDSKAGASYRENVLFTNTSRVGIKSSRIDLYFKFLEDSPEQVDAMKWSRQLAASSAPDLDPISYNFAFLFFEGYALIAWETIRGVIIAGSVVFLIVFILVADFLTCVLVGLMVVFVDIELVGSLHWFGLAFNVVTSINLLLAIGIAVDYAAFMAFSFMQRKGTRTERAAASLAHYGVAVFNGAATMFLAVLPMVGAKSFIFQTFFKMFASIVILGLWHGLIALPVILSFIGSPAYDNAVDASTGPHKPAVLGSSRRETSDSTITVAPTPLAV